MKMNFTNQLQRDIDLPERMIGGRISDTELRLECLKLAEEFKGVFNFGDYTKDDNIVDISQILFTYCKEGVQLQHTQMFINAVNEELRKERDKFLEDHVKYSKGTILINNKWYEIKESEQTTAPTE